MKKRSKYLILIILLVSLMPLSVFGKSTNSSERKLPRFVDNAGLLSEDEADNLTEKLNEISKRQNLDVVIITVDSLEGHMLLKLLMIPLITMDLEWEIN